VQFHVGGDRHPLVSVLTTSTGWATIDRFPFQILGLLALLVLFLMAATSHDFWLCTLTAPVWKALHMSVYVAYAALVLHIAFGALQSEAPGEAGLLLGLGVSWLAALHSVAAWSGRRADREAAITAGFVDVCAVRDIPKSRANRLCIWRACRGVPLRRSGVGNLERVPTPERTPRRRQDRRRLRRLPVARLRIPPGYRRRSSALHGSRPDISRQG
jgi:hypothetical protein